MATIVGLPRRLGDSRAAGTAGRSAGTVTAAAIVKRPVVPDGFAPAARVVRADEMRAPDADDVGVRAGLNRTAFVAATAAVVAGRCRNYDPRLVKDRVIAAFGAGTP